MGKPSKHTICTIIFAIAAVIAAAMIFYLTSQTPSETSSLSEVADNFLIDLFGSASSVYDGQANLWLGIDIRHWAHTVEFFLFGALTSLTVVSFSRRADLKSVCISLGACAGYSIIDQCHKLFVFGRHFDVFDLAMDALGYVIAIALVMLVTSLLTHETSD